MKLKLGYFFPLLALFLNIEIGRAEDLPQKPLKKKEIDFNSVGINSIDWEKLSGDEIEEYELYLEKNERESDFLYLFQAKNYLINGDINKAKFYLEKIRERSSKLSLIKKRYVALIAFIEGDYKKSFQIYDLPYFNTAKYYPHVCVMKVMSLMAMREMKKMEQELINCRATTSKFSSNQQVWLDSITDLALKKPYALKGGILQSVVFMLNDPEYLRIWLKLALYLNQEDIALKNISSMHESSYYSKKVREMVGLVHYRNKNFDLALKFIEDIDSANAENIKGNINLAKKEYELAYGHFKLALKQKENSLNSIERAIPLTWLLGEWKDGIDLISRIGEKSRSALDNKNDDFAGTKDIRKKVALETAFYLRTNEFKKAHENLANLKYLYKDHMPVEIEMMWAYNSLMVEDHKNLLRFSESACHKFDGISCWLYLNIFQWENLPKVVRRDEEIIQDKNFSVNSLKEAQVIEQMDEPQLVDQKDIEELDSNLINLEL